MKKTSFLLFLFGLLSFSLNAQIKLSPSADVSLLTCGPGADLYSTFGHTAIRVYDPINRIDAAFNYGTFSFTPDFYMKFTMGKLNYKLAVESFQSFVESYRYENRWVVEQTLNLTEVEKNKLFAFLQYNALPENREYLYDFFYDNCSTRPRNAIDSVLGDKLIYQYPTPQNDSTFKDILDVYLGNLQWPDVGMDMGLGSPADKVISEREKTFIPDYLLRLYDNAKVKSANGELSALVIRKRVIVEQIPYELKQSWAQPTTVFILVLLLWVLLAIIPKVNVVLPYLDVLLFWIIGLAGWLIIFLWFVTDHTTTENNLDINWANPFLFPLGIFAAYKNKPKWVKNMFSAFSVLCFLLLLLWPILPQNLNESFIPLIALLMWRLATHGGLVQRLLTLPTRRYLQRK